MLRREYSFKEYGQPQRERLAQLLGSLGVYCASRTWHKGLQLRSDAGAVGSLREVLPVIETAMRNDLLRASEVFLSAPPERGEAKAGFFWSFEPSGRIMGLLHINLWLISAPGRRQGLLGLGQEVLRTGIEEFMFWGMD